MKSTTELKRTGIGHFARVRFEKKMVIGIYSGTLMYANLYGDKYLD